MKGVLPSGLERILGFDSQSPGEGTTWSLETSWSWAPWITLLGCVAVIAWVAYFYGRESTTVSKRRKTMLASLRLIVFAVLLFMIAQVMINYQRTGLPYVVLLVDDSASMSIEDRYTDADLQETLKERVQAAGFDTLSRINLAKTLLLEREAELLTGIEDNYKLKVYFVSDTAIVQPTARTELIEKIDSLAASGQASRLGNGLRSVLTSLRGSPPAALVLLTDGITTEGQSLDQASEYARRKGVPLFTIGLGTEEPIRDIELTDLLVDEMVFVDDVVNFQVTLKSSGYDDKRVDVELLEKESQRLLAKTTVTLEQKKRTQRVRLPYRPTKEGKFEYIVRVKPLAEESQQDNNRQSRIVSVRKEQIRVLFAQAYPNYEFRYLKAMLERDSTIELTTVLQEADPDYAQQDRSALPVLPVRRDELMKYDVILFGDVNPSFLSSSVMASLRDFVQQKGGGMAIISGPRYTPLAYRNTPLASLFPIDLAAARTPAENEVQREAFVPELTDLGVATGHMQLGDTQEQSRTLWRKLPPMYWLLEAPEIKPGAHVLARHPRRLGGDGLGLPLICVQYVGAGKVLFHATDETWRWRFRVGDVLIARYWVQAIRYLARSKLLDGDRTASLTVDRREYRRGEPVRIRVRFVDERIAPAADNGVEVLVEQQGQKSRRIRLRRNATNRGIFEGVFTGGNDGNYHVWLVRPTIEGKAPSADFRMTAPPGEFAKVQMDSAELTRVASTTHGKFYRIEQADRLIEELPAGRQIPIESLSPTILWNRWFVLMLLLTFLIAEWILRKRAGLI